MPFESLAELRGPGQREHPPLSVGRKIAQIEGDRLEPRREMRRHAAVLVTDAALRHAERGNLNSRQGCWRLGWLRRRRRGLRFELRQIERAVARDDRIDERRFDFDVLEHQSSVPDGREPNIDEQPAEAEQAIAGLRGQRKVPDLELQQERVDADRTDRRDRTGLSGDVADERRAQQLGREPEPGRPVQDRDAEQDGGNSNGLDCKEFRHRRSLRQPSAPILMQRPAVFVTAYFVGSGACVCALGAASADCVFRQTDSPRRGRSRVRACRAARTLCETR